MKVLLVIGLVVLLAQQAFAQAPVHPLSRILLDLEGMPKAKVVEIATQQSTQQWKMDKGPLFASTPEVNKDPKKISQEVVFDGFFLPKSAKTKLAMFSDDGCDIFIDNKQVLKNFGKGQHLPSVEKESLHILEFKFEANRTYHVRVRYSNTIFLGPADIDGCTLFAFDDGGMVPEANINADFDRNGDVDRDDDKQKLKAGVGALVIRNHDKVYEDKKEPARRREVKLSLKGGAAGKIVVERGADKEVLKEIKGAAEKLESNLQLFDKQEKGTELFQGKDSVPLASGSYWLQGGAEPSELLRDQFLRVRLDHAKALITDRLNVTVLWVDLTARNRGKMTPKTNNLNDTYDNLLDIYGDDNLGVQRGTKDEENIRRIRGRIELPGSISPPDLSRYQGKEFKTIGFKGGMIGEGAVADFGFVFRRFFQTKSYLLGQVSKDKGETQLDGALRETSDVDPNDPFPNDEKQKGKQLLIFDEDGPTVTPNQIVHFRSIRNNFVEHIVFYYVPQHPERCSKRLRWAYSADGGVDKDAKPIVLFGVPNDNSKDNPNTVNEVIIDGEYPGAKGMVDLEVKFPTPVIKSALNTLGKQEIRRKGITAVIVEGKLLYGDAFLRKDKKIVSPEVIFVSDIEKVKHEGLAYEVSKEIKLLTVRFKDITEPASDGWEFVIKNKDGEDKKAGYKIVD